MVIGTYAGSNSKSFLFMVEAHLDSDARQLQFYMGNDFYYKVKFLSYSILIFDGFILEKNHAVGSSYKSISPHPDDRLQPQDNFLGKAAAMPYI